MCLLAIFMSSLEKFLFRSSAFFWLDCLVSYSVIWAVYIVWKLSPCWSHHLQIFFPILWVVCSFCLWFLLGFPCGSASKESTCNVGELGSIPGLGWSPGEGKGYLLQYSVLENSLDFVVRGVSQSRTQLNNFDFDWEFLVQIVKSLQCRRPGFSPWVRKIPWRRKWRPTPVLLARKFQRWRSLVGYSPWGHKELDTTEWLHFSLCCAKA